MHNKESGYISTDNQLNCALCYKSLHEAIKSMDTNISRMCEAWRLLLNLCIEDKTLFMIYYSAFEQNGEILNRGNSAIATDDCFICMFLHESIQIDCLSVLSTELLTDVHIHPFENLERMRSLIKARSVSGIICNNQPESLISRRNIRQERKNNKILPHIYIKLFRWFRLMTNNKKKPL